MKSERKADRETTITQSDLASITATAKHDVANHLPSVGITLGRDGYNLFQAVRALADRKAGLTDGKSAMDAKLEQDMLYTRQKRLRDAGELIELAEAERVVSVIAATTSNVVDDWGLDKTRRNDLMDRIAEAVKRAWQGDEDDDDEGGAE